MGLDAHYLLLWVEKEYGIHIPDSVASTIVTIDDLHLAVWNAMRANSPEVGYRKDAFTESLYDLVADELGIDVSELLPHLRFKEDLNCG